MKRYLCVIKQSPYASSMGLESLELALALSAFNQQVSLLFMADGVLHLCPNQTANAILYKDFTKAYAGLNLFDINDVYAEEISLHKYGLTSLLLKPQIIDQVKIIELIDLHDVVLIL